jgi:hypothetical protein
LVAVVERKSEILAKIFELIQMEIKAFMKKNRVDRGLRWRQTGEANPCMVEVCNRISAFRWEKWQRYD